MPHTSFMSNGDKIIHVTLYTIIPVAIVLIILLLVWGICRAAGSDYNPFEHVWIAAPLAVFGFIGLALGILSTGPVSY